MQAWAPPCLIRTSAIKTSKAKSFTKLICDSQTLATQICRVQTCMGLLPRVRIFILSRNLFISYEHLTENCKGSEQLHSYMSSSESRKKREDEIKINIMKETNSLLCCFWMAYFWHVKGDIPHEVSLHLSIETNTIIKTSMGLMAIL